MVDFSRGCMSEPSRESRNDHKLFGSPIVFSPSLRTTRVSFSRSSFSIFKSFFESISSLATTVKIIKTASRENKLWLNFMLILMDIAKLLSIFQFLLLLSYFCCWAYFVVRNLAAIRARVQTKDETFCYDHTP